MSQVNRVVDYITENGSITTLQAYERLGITRLPARVADIKKMGHEVQSERIKVKNRFGEEVWVKKYWF